MSTFTKDVGGTFIITGSSLKRKTIVCGCDDDSKRRRLDSRIETLKAGISTPASRGDTGVQSLPTFSNRDVASNPAGISIIGSFPKPEKKRTEPNQADVKLSLAWKRMLPMLLDDVLQYYNASRGIPLQDIGDVVHDVCPKNCTLRSNSTVTALFFGHFKKVEIRHCPCRSLSQALTRAGLFPSAPSQPRMAFSIDLLDFYSALFQRSCDAVTAFASATNAFYANREFFLTNEEGERVLEPFRRALGQSAQWLDTLHVLIQERVDHVLVQADAHGRGLTTLSTHNDDHRQDASAECTRRLRNLCPACFGLEKFGRSFADGSDIHVAADGCFQHKRLVSGGKGLPTHDPQQILSKSYVDSIGEQIEKARKASPRCRQSKVPDEALDKCQTSYEAANGDKKRSHTLNSRYDSLGWMALTCRHDVPLMLANIDTPGEQQKYVVALLVWLFSQLPANATHNILQPGIASRLRLAISVMHAYGHQWACQIVYNPRFMKGLGLSDGECVERLWAKLCSLIPIVRTSSHFKRISLTARQVVYIAAEILLGLGEWMSRRHKTGVVEQGSKAQIILEAAPVDLIGLREQWRLQQKSHSQDSRTPEPVRDALDTLVSFQKKMEKVEGAIQAAKSTISSHSVIPILDNLSLVHAEHVRTARNLRSTCRSVLEIYSPELQGLDLMFVQTLLVAKDLKVDIRARLTERFLEWEKLDSAKGSRNQPLGTKLHKQVMQGLGKRRIALVKKIEEYNQCCRTLQSTYKPSYRIPLPEALPVRVADLREDIELARDVCITPAAGIPPLWMTSKDVRKGIQAMHKVDRCTEEHVRLQLETDNMCQWFSRELIAVDIALSLLKDSTLSHQLTKRRQSLLHIKSRWTRSLGDLYQFTSRIETAATHAKQVGDLLCCAPDGFRFHLNNVAAAYQRT